MIRAIRRIIARALVATAVTVWYHCRARFRRACGRRILRGIDRKGIDCRIYGLVNIDYPERLEMGDRVRIGRGCYFFCRGGLTIGSNTHISRFVTIYTANHNTEGKAIPYDDEYICKPVTIGRAAWIGMNVCITPGVTIGDGAVIGMGTVVSQDVPPGAVVVGAPARIVKHRDMEHFRQLDSEGKHFGAMWPDK